MNKREVQLLTGKIWPSNDNLLEVGINSLLLFIQNTFTGPKLSSMENEMVDLSTEECAYELIEYPQLFKKAKDILVNSIDQIDLESKYWWAARTLFIHQRVLEQHSYKLFNEIKKYFDICETIILPELKSKLFLEIGIFYHYYGQDSIAKVYST